METFDEASLPMNLISFMAFNEVIFDESYQSPYYIQTIKSTFLCISYTIPATLVNKHF
jgi:hypothetical protein